MASGTLTADGTEQVIDTLDPGVPGFVFWYISLENMTIDEQVVIRERVDFGGDGTYEIFEKTVYSGEQTEPIVGQSESLMVLDGVPVRITLEETRGPIAIIPGLRG